MICEHEVQGRKLATLRAQEPRGIPHPAVRTAIVVADRGDVLISMHDLDPTKAVPRLGERSVCPCGRLERQRTRVPNDAMQGVVQRKRKKSRKKARGAHRGPFPTGGMRRTARARRER